MNERMKKILTIIGVIVIAVGVIWFMNSDIDQIEDTNGDDNYKLQTITDYNIIKMDIGSVGAKVSTGIISDTVKYSSDKFSGVMEIYSENIMANQMTITVNHAQVKKGNFRMVLLVNDEIVHDFELNELTQTYVLEKVKGNVSIRIAGESAEYMFDFSII